MLAQKTAGAGFPDTRRPFIQNEEDQKRTLKPA